MALNLTSTYVGKDSKEFISALLMAGVTLSKPTITIKQNVNYKTRITKIDMSDIIKKSDCNFVDGGAVDVKEKWLEVEKLDVNLELCKNDFYEDFIGENMGTTDLPPSAFMKYLIGQIGATIADSNEKAIWQGDGVTFSGFETKFRADADVIDVATPIAIDSSNVVQEIRRTIKSVSPQVYTNPDAVVYVSSSIYQALREANTDKIVTIGVNGEEFYGVDGVTVEHAAGMNVGNMAISTKSNLWFGTWLNSDQSKVKVLDMADLDGSENFRFIVSYFAGVEYGYGEEVGYYDFDSVP